MEKYVCVVCGYVYDPEVGDPDNGVAPGTAFADVPEDWVCPLCGVGKDQLEVEDKKTPIPPPNSIDRARRYMQALSIVFYTLCTYITEFNPDDQKNFPTMPI